MEPSGPSAREKRGELAPGEKREWKIGPDGLSKISVWREFYALSPLRASQFHFDRGGFALAGNPEHKVGHILGRTKVVFD